MISLFLDIWNARIVILFINTFYPIACTNKTFQTGNYFSLSDSHC